MGTKTCGDPGAEISRSSGADVAEGLCQDIFDDHFFQEYWERRPLHYCSADKGSSANRLPEALFADDLAAAIDSAAGMNLKMFRSNEMSDLKSPWHSYLAGFSMVINQADRHHKVLFDLCKGLANRHFHHVFAVVYLTPPGSQAVRVHTDDQDVILLQVWGSKHWTLYNAPTHLPYTEEMLGKEQAVPENLIGKKEMDFTIHPHDVLYIPRGHLHEAATSSEPSLHITLTVPTSDFCWGVQMVKHLNTHLRNEPFRPDLRSLCQASLAQCLTGPAQHSEEELDSQIQEVLSTWTSSLSAKAVLNAFEHRMDKANFGQEQQFARLSGEGSMALITRNRRVRLMHGIVCLCEEGSEEAIFARPDGRCMKMKITISASKLIRSLTATPQWVRDLPCTDGFERLCILHVLLDAGVIQVFLHGPEESLETNEHSKQ
ncbi:unnamed protein product [Durusdinium trenchii]|uniref:Bifunctional lysine-specific demethylase and histidyl-hydroxylase NO66 (Histone lysine demethylase NO66) n=2 Tax=Durusdinium trenchii TaxID=1381693 RepID=A0ABP0MHH4_9DINO